MSEYTLAVQGERGKLPMLSRDMPKEVAASELTGLFTTLEAARREAAAGVVTMLRQATGWHRDNVVGGNSVDISNFFELPDGSMFYAAIVYHPTAQQTDAKPVVIDISEILSEGGQALLEYYTAAEVARARVANPDASLCEIRDASETTNYTFFSTQGTADSAPEAMSTNLVSDAQSEYFLGWLETFTHHDEAYRLQQTAEYDTDSLRERLRNAMQSVELYIDAITNLLDGKNLPDPALVGTEELDALRAGTELEAYLRHAHQVKNEIEDAQENTVTYREAIIEKMRQYDDTTLGDMLMVFDARTILAEVSFDELEQYRALTMGRMTVALTEVGGESGWSALNNVVGEIKHAAMYRNRDHKRSASVLEKVLQNLRKGDVATMQVMLGMNPVQSSLDNKYLAIARELYALKGRAKSRGEGTARSIQGALQAMSADSVAMGGAAPLEVADEVQHYLPHIIGEAENSHMHGLARRMLPLSNLIFDIDSKLRYVDGELRDCSDVWSSGVVDVLNRLTDMRNYRQVHDQIHGKEFAIPPQLSLFLQQQAMLNIFLSNAQRSISPDGGLGAVE